MRAWKNSSEVQGSIVWQDDKVWLLLEVLLKTITEILVHIILRCSNPIYRCDFKIDVHYLFQYIWPCYSVSLHIYNFFTESQNFSLPPSLIETLVKNVLSFNVVLSNWHTGKYQPSHCIYSVVRLLRKNRNLPRPCKLKKQWKDTIRNQTWHLLKPYFTRMLKSCLTLSLRWLEQNWAHIELVKGCGHAGKRKHQETHRYTITPTAWSLMCLKWDLAQKKPTQGKSKGGWGKKLLLSIHTAAGEKRGTKKMYKECIGLGHKGDDS